MAHPIKCTSCSEYFWPDYSSTNVPLVCPLCLKRVAASSGWTVTSVPQQGTGTISIGIDGTGEPMIDTVRSNSLSDVLEGTRDNLLDILSLLDAVGTILTGFKGRDTNRQPKRDHDPGLLDQAADNRLLAEHARVSARSIMDLLKKNGPNKFPEKLEHCDCERKSREVEP